MNFFKKLIIVTLCGLLMLLVIYYFLINPYQFDKFKCIHNSGSPATKLHINKFLPNTVEVIFSNQIFDQRECKKIGSIIECSLTDPARDMEKITFNLSTYQLFHLWLGYDSGKYIYDKTQIAKTEQLDSYGCISVEK
jgi:hypothetical protein